MRAQQIPWNSAFVIHGTYVTTSRVYYYPDATISDIRNEYAPIDKLSGIGGEFRIPFTDAGFYFAVSADLITRTQTSPGLVFDSLQGRLFSAPEEEGVRFIPVELGLHAYIPLGSEIIKLTMGGGVGFYHAVRTYSIAGVSVAQSGAPISVGIHIGVGLEYRIWGPILARGEVKFRDPEVTSESRFEQATAAYEGRIIRFPQDPIKTKINVDGMTLSLGLMMEL